MSRKVGLQNMPNEERRDKTKNNTEDRAGDMEETLEWSNTCGIGAPEMNETVRAP